MRFIKAVAALCVIIAGAAEAQERPFAGRPRNAPVSAQSAFEPALACMDELLSRSHSLRAGHYLVPTELTDPTQKGGFTRDMIIGAATKMSRRSHFFRIVLDPTLLPKGAGFFRTLGSVTALDQQVQSKDSGGGLSIGSIVGATAINRTGVSNLTLSLYLVDADMQMVDGTFHSSTLLLESKGKARLLSGALSFLNGSLSMNSSRTDGPQAGVKALIDLALIEAVGSLAQVPYANCLATVGGAAADEAIWDRYRRLKPPQQREAILSEMIARGLAAANPNPAQLKQAIAAFERSQGMTPVGEIRFEVYAALQRIGQMAAPMNRPNIGAPAVKVSGVPGPFRYGSDGIPAVAAGDKLAFQATVAEPAYVACYYTDSVGKVTRVFPNPSRPLYQLKPGEVLRMPGDQDHYVIRGETPDTGEWFTCLAGRSDFLARIAGSVPDIAFTPLPGITSADQLVDAALAAESSLSHDTLTFRVN